MRKLNFYQDEERQVCRVQFGNSVIAAKIKWSKEIANIELKECINSDNKEDVRKANKYEDRSVYFEFSNVESIETVIGWLGDLRNKFIQEIGNECK